jgi:hypothetical protein
MKLRRDRCLGDLARRRACVGAQAQRRPLRLAVDGASITGRLDVAVRDLDAAVGLDADGNGEITWAELSAAGPRIAGYLEHRLALAADGAACPLRLGAGAVSELSDGAYWAVPVSAVCPHAPHPRIAYSLLFDID